MVPQKKRGPSPTGKGVQIQVRLQPDLLEPLDAWIAQQPDFHSTRPDAIRRILRDRLLGDGFPPAASEEDM